MDPKTTSKKRAFFPRMSQNQKRFIWRHYWLIVSLVLVVVICLGAYTAVSALFSGSGKVPAGGNNAEQSSDAGNPGQNNASGFITDLSSILGRSLVSGKGMIDPSHNTDEKLIALTFDDGPSEHSVTFIEELNVLGVRCTFFLQGYLIESYPEALEAMVAGGHQIASHSYDHPNLATSSNNTVMEQIDKTEELLSGIDGKDGHWLRCPYGESSDFVRGYIQSPIIYWSIDSEDWRSLDRAAVHDTIVSNAYDGAIILAHEIYETSRTGSIDAIKELLQEGYKFVTVEELLKRRGVEIQNGETYFDAQNNGINLPREDVDLHFAPPAPPKK